MLRDLLELISTAPPPTACLAGLCSHIDAKRRVREEKKEAHRLSRQRQGGKVLTRVERMLKDLERGFMPKDNLELIDRRDTPYNRVMEVQTRVEFLMKSIDKTKDKRSWKKCFRRRRSDLHSTEHEHIVSYRRGYMTVDMRGSGRISVWEERDLCEVRRLASAKRRLIALEERYDQLRRSKWPEQIVVDWESHGELPPLDTGLAFSWSEDDSLVAGWRGRSHTDLQPLRPDISEHAGDEVRRRDSFTHGTRLQPALGLYEPEPIEVRRRVSHADPNGLNANMDGYVLSGTPQGDHLISEIFENGLGEHSPGAPGLNSTVDNVTHDERSHSGRDMSALLDRQEDNTNPSNNDPLLVQAELIVSLTSALRTQVELLHDIYINRLDSRICYRDFLKDNLAILERFSEAEGSVFDRARQAISDQLNTHLRGLERCERAVRLMERRVEGLSNQLTVERAWEKVIGGNVRWRRSLCLVRT